MNYTRSAVYTRVHDAIRAQYPDSYVTGRYVPKPSTFPAILIHEVDRSRPQQFTQLDYEDVQWESVFEVSVVSAKPKAASEEAYAIMDIVRRSFGDLYYRELSEVNVDNGNTFTIVGRFRRVIGGGDTMPQE